MPIRVCIDGYLSKYYDVVVTGLVVSGPVLLEDAILTDKEERAQFLEESDPFSNFVGLTYPFTTLSAALSGMADTQVRAQMGHCRT
jgi:hypothetical protein